MCHGCFLSHTDREMPRKLMAVIELDNINHVISCVKTVDPQKLLNINSTYSADASMLVQMSTESAQSTCMHCYKSQTPADTMTC